MTVTQWRDLRGNAISDSSGNYTIASLGAETGLTVTFTDCSAGPIWLTKAVDNVAVVEGQTTTVDATLERAGVIAGHVEGPSGPVSGICVSASGFDADVPGGYAQSDPGGDYAIAGLAPGDYLVYFYDCRSKPELHYQYWQGARNYADASRVTVTNGQTTDGIDAVMAVAGSIAGTVTDSGGNPLADICVTAMGDMHSGANGGTDRTQADGRYKITGLFDGDYTVQFVPCNSGDFTFLQLPDPVTISGSAQVTGVDVQMTRAGHITGRITDADGNPMAGMCAQAFGPTSFVGKSDADGNYDVGLLVTGDYYIEFYDCTSDRLPRAQWWDDRDGVSDLDTVHVETGETTSGIDSRMHADAEIAGRVTDTDGNPIEGICVAAGGAGGGTGADGRYRLSGLDTGHVDVHFSDCRTNPEFSDRTTSGVLAVVNATKRVDVQLERADNTKPVSAADALPAYTTDLPLEVSYTSSDNRAVTSVELWAKGPSDSDYSSLDSEAPDYGDGSGSFSVSLAEGSWSFYTRARDAAGNYEAPPGSGAPDATTLVDTKAPTVTFTNPHGDGSSVFTLGHPAGELAFDCDDSGGSGMLTCAGTPALGAALDTGSVGLHTVSVAASDKAGNDSTGETSYVVYWPFGGFQAPIGGALTTQKAGSTLPVKFSLGGDRGLNILSATAVGSIDCPGGPIGNGQVQPAAGDVTYDDKVDRYTFSWKTEKAWGGSCRRLTLKLADTSQQVVDVKFSK